MKNIYKYTFISICLSIFPAVSQSASLEIDRALEILLADYDIDGNLEVRDEGALNSGYYLVQPGDTLDEIILKLVGETTIRKGILREAFVYANPNSFRNKNPNYMLAGIRLRVPDADDIIALLFDMNSPKMRDINQSRESWVRFP
tara:strand:+ start:66 stop:500 length:435 start_codon:yes stop_codon:yes gene_type:complete